MNWRSFLLSWIYAALLSGAALSCPATAFEISVSLSVLWLVCTVAVGVLALLWHLPAQGLTLSGAALVYGVALWYFRQPVADGFSAILQAVTGLYARAYPGLREICLLPDAVYADTTICFAALAVPLAALLLWTLTRQTAAWLTLLLCAPWLAMCLVVVDQLPAMWVVLLLLGSGVLLVLTQDSRRGNDVAGLRLTLVLALPVTILVVGVAWLQPPQDYARAAWPDALRERVNQQITQLSGVQFTSNGSLQWQPQQICEQLWTAEHDEVDLTQLGERRNGGVTLLELYGGTTGRVYLRGASLTEYRDNAWFSAGLSAAGNPLEQNRKSEYWLQIRSQVPNSLLYTPYYPVETAGIWLNDEYYYNAEGLTEYRVGYQPEAVQIAKDPSYVALVYNAYCQLPASTAEGLRALAEEAGLTALPVEQQPDAVADYVRRAARYSLKPEAMPENADFPIWFLTEAESGYCVHFATAAATMLRALGIPARYVTGFLTSVRAEHWVEVTDREAHAWVEYWRDDLGWIPLETTPGEDRVIGTVLELPKENETEIPDEPEPVLPFVEVQPNPPEKKTDPMPDESELTQIPGADNATITPQRSWSWLLWLTLCTAAVSALFGSRWLRLWWRKRQRCSTANAQALMLWRRLERLANHTGTKVPPRLKYLAQRARFSQHSLSWDELAELQQQIKILTELLREQSGVWPWFRNRWIWADC